MQPIMSDVSLGFLVKCLLPVPIILLIRRLYSGFEMRELVRVDRFIAFVLVLYIVLGAVHIVNLTLCRIGSFT